MSSARILTACTVLGLMAGSAAAQPVCGGAPGPDVIVGDINGVSNFTVTGGLDAISLGTTSCNMGQANLLWNATPANTHPVIGGTLYRYQVVNGAAHFDQIGQSWLKHAFTALTQNLCCTCNGQGGAVLGVGCSDPYTSDRNGSQGGLGPKYQVNAHTGFYPTGTPPRPSGGNAGRLEFLPADVAATPGGTGQNLRFFGECQYVTPDDAAANNQNNNASYREMSVTGTGDFNFAFAGNTVRGAPAVRAWRAIDATVTQTDVQVAGDGLYIVSSKATPIAGGMFHYEYVVYNMNGDRDGGSFSVPVPDAAAVTNMGFNCPVYRYGDGNGGASFSSTPWTTNRANGVVTWSTQSLCQNGNANAIRWGNSFSFRFDSDAAPVAGGNVGVGLWKPGTPSAFNAAAQSPGTLTTLPPTQISGTGSANPPSAQIATTSLMTVLVSPAEGPVSTGIVVRANLEALNGSSTQAFYDDGTHGDVQPGDRVYSYLATLAEPMSAGTYTIPYTISDDQGRTATCGFQITATAAPTGQCCVPGQACSVVTSYTCLTTGGVYGGNGTNCLLPQFNANRTFPAAIPDGTGNLQMTFTVPAGTGTINNNVTLTLGLVHSWAGDVVATLSHNATTVSIMNRPGGVNNSRNLNGTYTFADSAATSFATAAVQSDPVAGGTYRPVGLLSAFNGQSWDGTWTVTVSDAALGEPGSVTAATLFNPVPYSCPTGCGSADFDCDGDVGTDADIEAFFACIGGHCPAAPCGSTADFDHDGDTGTDADIEAFFRVLGGNPC
jgi:subtilisin-like proprotein convertase family protein